MVCMRDKAWGLVACREIAEHFQSARRRHPITPPLSCTTLGMVEEEFVGLPGKVLTQNATRMLRFFAHAVGWLHSMVLIGRCGRGSSSSDSGGCRCCSEVRVELAVVHLLRPVLVVVIVIQGSGYSPIFDVRPNPRGFHSNCY